MTTDDELRAELAVCDAATRGPWLPLDGEPDGFDDSWDVIADDGCGVASMSTTAPVAKYPRDIAANAKFMANARTGYPAALRELLELRRLVRELGAAQVAADEYDQGDFFDMRPYFPAAQIEAKRAAWHQGLNDVTRLRAELRKAVS